MPSRADAILKVANDKKARLPGYSHSKAVIEAEEFVAALEALGIVRFDGDFMLVKEGTFR